jgi:hypothetical protein
MTPQRLLIGGLGHVGQAICWALGFLLYPTTGAADLTLVDFDTIIEANCGTGLLTTPGDVGLRKARVIATRLEQVRFTTAIVERRVDDNTRRTIDEPMWALAGFDQPEPRRALANAGFAKVIDLGLGGGPGNYLDILLHVFPSGLRPEQAWPLDTPATATTSITTGYRNLIERDVVAGILEGAARCGVIGLAG